MAATEESADAAEAETSGQDCLLALGADMKVDALSGSATSTATGGATLLTSTLNSTIEGCTLESLQEAEGAGTAERDELAYPRVLTAWELLEESDDESVFCGPPSEPGEGVRSSELRALEAWGIVPIDDRSSQERRPQEPEGAAPREGRPREQGRPGDDDAPQNRAEDLIAAKGDVAGDNQKFICVFQIGLEDDEEFCLVKRILGKAGNNMRRIAEECAAKVRLRGIGSGFLEGSDGREANMPLQLNVSCTDYESYLKAVERVSNLLKDLYKHYRRYARSKGMEPPDVSVCLEEVRRDDLNLDLLAQKAQRSASQRDRDRRAKREQDRARGFPGEAPDGARGASRREHSRERISGQDPDAEPSEGEADDDADGGGRAKNATRQLPGGLPLPTTAAGRRAAARVGGAEVAALVSAAAREADQQQRERQRDGRGGGWDREDWDYKRRGEADYGYGRRESDYGYGYGSSRDSYGSGGYGYQRDSYGYQGYGWGNDSYGYGGYGEGSSRDWQNERDGYGYGSSSRGWQQEDVVAAAAGRKGSGAKGGGKVHSARSSLPVGSHPSDNITLRSGRRGGKGAGGYGGMNASTKAPPPPPPGPPPPDAAQYGPPSKSWKGGGKGKRGGESS